MKTLSFGTKYVGYNYLYDCPSLVNFIEFSSCVGKIEKASEDSVIYVNDTKILDLFILFYFM